MRPFKIGDTVMAFGCYGTVIKNNPDVVAYLEIGYMEHREATFHSDGYFQSWHKKPSLVHVEDGVILYQIDGNFVTEKMYHEFDKKKFIEETKKLMEENYNKILKKMNADLKEKKIVKMAPALFEVKPGKYRISSEVYPEGGAIIEYQPPEKFIRLLWDRAVEFEVEEN